MTQAKSGINGHTQAIDHADIKNIAHKIYQDVARVPYDETALDAVAIAIFRRSLEIALEWGWIPEHSYEAEAFRDDAS